MPGSQFPDEEMGVKIAEQKHGLEEHEAGQPHMGCTTEIGGQQAANEGLHAEQEYRPKENGAGEHGNGQLRFPRLCSVLQNSIRQSIPKNKSF
ncbi:MAG: hypothetical protein A4E72_01519 [Syntrophus sp. PtaU1.Bin208]|nr:MAG: hypothetical protein A4E72_01519 [Syntrophus sp. PtaU1.Bin208]